MAAAHLDETYHYVISVFVERGQAPHFTEIAARFAIPAEEGKRRLHELMAARLPNWLFPETDLIASFAPFSNLPTQYRISVLRPDYVSKLPETVPAFVQRLLEVSGNSPFWDLRPD